MLSKRVLSDKLLNLNESQAVINKTMNIGQVKELYLYPVKSLAGVTSNKLDINSRGVLGDRLFALYNAEGKIASGKNTRRFFRLDNLLEIDVTLDNQTVSVLAKSNQAFSVPSSAADDYLSNLLECNVEVKEEKHIPHLDDGAVHLITTADLLWLTEKHGSSVDVLRFRPNILVQSDLRSRDLLAYAEILIGDSTFKPIGEAERCRMITLRQKRLKEDKKLLRSVVVDKKVDFGIYIQALNMKPVNISDVITTDQH